MIKSDLLIKYNVIYQKYMGLLNKAKMLMAISDIMKYLMLISNPER